MARKPLVDHLLLVAARWHATRLYDGFLAATRSATRRQDLLLRRLVHRNADSDYGTDHGFGQIHNYEDFVSNVPVQTYEDLSPYIDRVKGGEFGALFGSGQKVHMFAMTSGTSSEPKYIPVTEDFLQDFRRGWNAFGVKALMDHPGSFLRPIVQVTSPMDEFHTKAGIPCGAITGLMASTQMRLVRKYYVCPGCVAYIKDPTARYYTIMRLSIPCDVSFLVTASPATLLKLARVADRFGDRIVRDIRDGTLNEEFEIPEEIRSQLEPRLLPDAGLARRLEQMIQTHGALLPRHYWDLRFLANWTGGTMGLYLQHYPHYFGDVPVRDIGLLASEGRMSIPVRDGSPEGILEVMGNFYEFIPKGEIDSAKPVVLRSHEVEAGEDYFILLTSSAGLCRYNIGDLIRVNGFEGEAPVIEFLNKGAHISSLSGEKLTEQQAVLSVNAVCRKHGMRIDNFVLAPQWDDPPYYLLHVERNGDASWEELGLAELLETELCNCNCEYLSKRQSGRIGALRLNPLPPGSLQGADNVLRSRFRNYTNEQYKHQFLYARPGDDRMLRELSGEVGTRSSN